MASPKVQIDPGADVEMEHTAGDDTDVEVENHDEAQEPEAAVEEEEDSLSARTTFIEYASIKTLL
jgi:hypothetical protein